MNPQDMANQMQKGAAKQMQKVMTTQPKGSGAPPKKNVPPKKNGKKGKDFSFVKTGRAAC